MTPEVYLAMALQNVKGRIEAILALMRMDHTQAGQELLEVLVKDLAAERDLLLDPMHGRNR